MTYIRETSFNEEDHPTLKLIKEDYGFIPNFFKAQAARPDLLDAEVQLVDATLIKDGALTRQQKEYISSSAPPPTSALTALRRTVKSFACSRLKDQCPSKLLSITWQPICP
jgi:hypothetical protein